MNQIKTNLKEFKNGIKTMFKEFFKKETNKKQRANMWTFSRLVCAFIIPILTAIGALANSLPILIAAFTTAGLGAMTDFFDGRSARKHNSTSEFGALLDVVTDKTFALLLGISLSILNPLFLLNIAGEIAITITNTIYKLKHEDLKLTASKIGKIKQWPLSLTFVLGILSILFPQLTIVTNITIIITLLTQLATIESYIIDNNKSVKQLEKEKLLDTEINTDSNEEKLAQTKTINKHKEELIEIKKMLNNMLDEPQIKKDNIKRITPGTPKIPTKRQVIIFIGKYINPVRLINHKITKPIIALIIRPINFLPFK